MSLNGKYLQDIDSGLTIDQSLEPYIGPRPFTSEDQSLFFGRNSETDEIISLIISHRLVLIYAQSGVGKTSIFNAQVIPMLKSRYDVLPMTRVGSASMNEVISRINDDKKSFEIENLYMYNAFKGLRPETNSQS